jgi:hypothetical protein
VARVEQPTPRVVIRRGVTVGGTIETNATSGDSLPF